LSHFVAVSDFYFGLGTTEAEAIQASIDHSGKDQPIHLIFSSDQPITVHPGAFLNMTSDGDIRNTAIVKWSNGKIEDRREVPDEYQAKGLPETLLGEYVGELTG